MKSINVFVYALCMVVLAPLKATSIGQIITESDRYVYNLNIVANPTDINDSVITVSASNVLLDLNGGSIVQDPTNTVAGLTGITILPNLTNILITNGNIVNLTGYGIVVGDGCSGIEISNMHISGCQEGGILVDGKTTGTGIYNLLLDDVGINYTTGLGGNPSIGLKMTKVIGGIIKNSTFAQNDAHLTSTGYGAYIDTVVGLEVDNTQFSANAGFELGIGAYITASYQCTFKNSLFTSNFSRNTTSTAFGAGAVVVNSSQCRFEACEISNNFNNVGMGIGLQVENSQEVFVCDSTIEDNLGGNTAVGIFLSNTEHSDIQDNIIRSNEASVGSAYGIRVTGTNVAGFIANNDLINNISTTTTVSSYGIIDEAAISQVAVLSNRAYNQTVNYHITYPVGITLPVLSASLTNNVIGIPSGTGGLFDNQSINI